MEKQWRDISIPLNKNMTTWPGDPPFSLKPAARIAHGDSCNVSEITLSTHTGTHCDAPWHFIEEGATLDTIDLSVFMGEALVLDFSSLPVIRAADLPPTQLPERILLKTAQSDRPTDAPFDPNFTALEEDAAARLVEDGVRLVGIDTLSIAPSGKSAPVHRALLQAEIVIIEGLRLGGVLPGTYEFLALPLAVDKADGAPCRALLRL
ncbi:MAG: cyclase family protein [Candidatus Hydrogenedentales bacterium]|jgi:arylformamidase